MTDGNLCFYNPSLDKTIKIDKNFISIFNKKVIKSEDYSVLLLLIDLEKEGILYETFDEKNRQTKLDY